MSVINSLKSIKFQNFLRPGLRDYDAQKLLLKLDDKHFKFGLLFLSECIFGDGLAKIHEKSSLDFKNDKNFYGKDDKAITFELEFDRNLLEPPITYIMNIMLLKQDEYALNELIFYPQKKEFGAAHPINLSHILLDTKKGSEKISTFVNGKYVYYSKDDSPINLNTSESVFRQNLNLDFFAHILPIKRSIEALGKMLK